MVAAAAAVAVIVVFYLAVWEPLYRGAADLERRIAAERELTARVAALSAEAERLRATGGGEIEGRGDSLLSIVDRSSREAGLADAVQRIQPEGGDRAAVTLEAAGFNRIIFWLHDLERRYGVTVSAVTVTRGDEEGTIQARMSLQRNAG